SFSSFSHLTFSSFTFFSHFSLSASATSVLFENLKTVPVLILESSVEENYFYLNFGYWGLNWPKSLYESFVSEFSWPEVSKNSGDEYLKRFVLIYHYLVGGMLADLHFLTDFPPETSSRPLLPELLSEMLKDIPSEDVRELLDFVVPYYRNLYEELGQNDESCWIPELSLELAQSLMKLDGPRAKDQVAFSVQQWLKLHELPQPEGLKALLDTMKSALTPADEAYVKELNQCLADAGESRQLSIADACYKRGNAYYELGWRKEGIPDYDRALEMYEKAIVNYNWALEISPNFAGAEKNRGTIQDALDEIRGKEFEFEVVTVDAEGNIADRRNAKAYQKIEKLDSDITLEMIYIPGGTFMMGSPETEKGRYPRESPQHEVTLSPFFMGKYPVTQEQYEAVTGENPSCFRGANRPVSEVSWNDAVAFCEKLSRRTGKTYRMPTEAEWEYACRAGTTTPFHFGETITPKLANYNYNCGKTTDVGTFPPNAFGLCDMHGNIWEWCRDWFDDYPSGHVIDPEGPSSGSNRVKRGGSWSGSAGSCRSAGRGRDSPGRRSNALGLRLVLSPGQQ
ncbi:SUMF1/EgtB/PvdO family nonheme iron enzyme, partial [Desulfobacterales bacterium HSG2]|nr:SUMF1/EgtB/PvdO family nonheme iron enzyme [Desulfobacterales bacterium HSG2]